MSPLEIKFNSVDLLAMDFDGVLTDGYVYTDQEGRESVRCSRKDGLGILLLKRHGIKVVVISKETNPVTEMRCRKIGAACYSKVDSSDDKKALLSKVAKEMGCGLERVAYIGDDLNDMAVLKAVGTAISVADAHPSIKVFCDYVTEARGGEHAVREVCEKILEAKGVKIQY